MMLLLLFIIFVVVVFNLSRVTFWCLERLWLCVVEIRPSRVRSLIMFLQVLNMCVAWPKFLLCEVCVFDFVLVVFLDDVIVFNLSRVTLWCLERLWLCVVVGWPVRV